MHNLPVFAMGIIIFFAWQNNWVGGIGFLVISLFFFIMVNSNMNNGSGVMSSAVFIISLPALIISILYFVDEYIKRLEL